ncbi:MAG: shikimate kinase [Clostridia bacterium]|nr:shikimate kinase [Clostridia bacterium]
MDNIILIGMPASGKSAAGVLLAKTLGYDFVDSDLVIQRTSGRLLADIIATDGPEAFIQLEESVNLSIDVHRSIIATGGSAVYGTRAMERFRAEGTVVYLETSLETLEKRLKGKSILTRGVVMRTRGETFEDLYRERTPLYEKYADITVGCDSLDIERTVNAICEALQSSN